MNLQDRTGARRGRGLWVGIPGLIALVVVAAGVAGCGDSVAGAPSCAVAGPGTAGCGSAGDDCCHSPRLPGGSYARTYTNDGSGAVDLADVARVSGLRLDKYLVTVGRFRRFVAASLGGWTPPAGAGKHAHVAAGGGLVDSAAGGREPGWQAGDTIQLATSAGDWSARLACEPSFHTWTDTPASNETLPINCVDWYEAYAFCIWDGGFLPSEAEWELAAAGGDQQRQYPWGATVPGGSTQYLISGCNYPTGATSCSGVANIAPVGTAALGAGRWGQVDLAGNLSEWTLDWYGPYVDPCIDCVSLVDYSYRVVRGGSFGTDVDNIFPAARNGDVPQSRNVFYGVRCARSP